MVGVMRTATSDLVHIQTCYGNVSVPANRGNYFLRDRLKQMQVKLKQDLHYELNSFRPAQ